jgi:hypothetical protein
MKKFEDVKTGNTRLLRFGEFKSVSEGSTNQVDYYVEKFKDKMPATTEQGAAYWIDGIGGLSASEKKSVFSGIRGLVTRESGRDMPEWANESAIFEDGFGTQNFVRIKKGDTYVYLFKIELETEHKGIALMIGKYSPHIVLSDSKNTYGVMSAAEMTEDEIEQGAVDPDRFEIKPGNVKVEGDSTGRFISLVTICIDDYVSVLQPKVVRIYDEIPSTCSDPNYSAAMAAAMADRKWDLQEMEAGRMNVITKTSISI